jgi:hypothetical protein
MARMEPATDNELIESNSGCFGHQVLNRRHSEATGATPKRDKSTQNLAYDASFGDSYG